MARKSLLERGLGAEDSPSPLSPSPLSPSLDVSPTKPEEKEELPPTDDVAPVAAVDAGLKAFKLVDPAALGFILPSTRGAMDLGVMDVNVEGLQKG